MLSKSTESTDRTKKLPIYAAHRVRHVYSLDDHQHWRDVRIYEGDARVRGEPFAAIEIELAALWTR